MKTIILSTGEPHLPHKILVRTKDGELLLTNQRKPSGNVIGICVKDKVWYATNPSNNGEPPEAFLEKMRKATRLPLAYPTEEDFDDLNTSLVQILRTVATVRLFGGLPRFSSFMPYEKRQHLDYYDGKIDSIYARFVIPLKELQKM